MCSTKNSVFFPTPSKNKVLTCCHITSTSFSACFLQIRIFSYFNVLNYVPPKFILGLPRWRRGKESTCQCRRCKRLRFDPWVRKIPWSRKQQPTPVFLPGKFLGQRSLAGSSGHKESDTTEQLNTHIQIRMLKSQPSGPRNMTVFEDRILLSHVQLFHDPMDCSPPGSSVHGISQARMLEWVAISFSRRSSQPRDQTHISCVGRQIKSHQGKR